MCVARARQLSPLHRSGRQGRWGVGTEVLGHSRGDVPSLANEPRAAIRARTRIEDPQRTSSRIVRLLKPTQPAKPMLRCVLLSGAQRDVEEEAESVQVRDVDEVRCVGEGREEGERGLVVGACVVRGGVGVGFSSWHRYVVAVAWRRRVWCLVGEEIALGVV
jgi:hypothetical protein